MEGDEGGTDEGQGMLIFDGDVIQAMVVYTGTESAVLLAHKEETRSYR